VSDIGSGISGRVRYHTGRVRYLLTALSSIAVSSAICAFSSVLRSACCVELLPFHRRCLGALVTGWLGYPRFGTLLLLYRSGVSRFLVFWFSALLFFVPLALW
jgi:hypothetical protein